MTWVGGILMGLGTFFFLAGTIGFVRLPDVFTRMHALSKSDTLGAILSLLGVACITGWSLVSVKLVLVGVFILIANPTATHALARVAIINGVRPWTRKDRGSDGVVAQPDA